MYNVAFKIAISQRIGSGHFYRSLKFAKKLIKKNVKVFFLFDHNFKNMNLKSSLKKNKIKYKIFKKKILPIKKFIKNKKIQTLILDDPSIFFLDQKKLYNIVNKLIVFQDIPKKNYCDILINYNYIKNAKKKYYKLSKKNTKFFLGTKYFIFNKNIKNKKNKKNQICVFFGGLSNKNIIFKTLNSLKKLKIKNIKIYFFLGIYNKDYGYIKKKFIKKFAICKNVNQNFFLNLLSQSTLFIGAGGTALLESISLGIPSIIYSTSNNQIDNAKNFDKDKLCLYLGRSKDNFNSLKLQSLVDTLLTDKNYFNKIKEKLENNTYKIASEPTVDLILKNIL